MRWIWASALVAACGFQPGRLATTDGGGGDDDADDALVLPEGQHWIVDTAAEFGALGHTVDGLTVETPGSLTQVGYTYGGLLMSGKQGQQLWTIGTAGTLAFSAIDTLTPDGITLWGTEFTDTGSNLDRAGVVTNDVFTIWFEGDVLLDAADIVSLNADGAGFVDLKLPTGWAHLESRTDGLKAFPAVATAGWYPVRLGWGEGTSGGFFDFRRGPSGTAVHFSRDRLRAPTSKVRGVMREVYYRQIFGGAELTQGAPVAAVEQGPLLATTDFTPALPLGAGGDDDWSARWSGQLYAAMPGTYSLQATTDDGNQVMLAGVNASAAWTRGVGASSLQSTVTADLAIGWHDVVLDYNQVGGNHNATLVVLAAPEAGLVGAPIPQDRLRPVEPRRDRLVSQTRKFSAVNVPNNAAGPNRGIAFVGLPNELVSAIDISISLDTDHLDQLVFRMTPPAGTPIVVASHPPGGGTVGIVQFHTTAVGLVGQPLDGSWMINIADDTMGANTTSLTEVAITMHTNAGPGQVSTESTWVSSVRDAGAAPVHVIDVTWVERAMLASEVFVRSCAMADCSDNPTWGTAIGQSGTAELTTPYLQSKVVMHTDGTTESVFDTLAITYRTD